MIGCLKMISHRTLISQHDDIHDLNPQVVSCNLHTYLATYWGNQMGQKTQYLQKHDYLSEKHHLNHKCDEMVCPGHITMALLL